MTRLPVIAVGAAVLTAACAAATSPGSQSMLQTTPAAREARADSAVAALHALFDDAWAEDLRGNPLFASRVGVRDYDALLPDPSERARLERLERLRVRLGRLAAIDREALPRDEQINADIFRRLTETAAREIELRGYLMPFTTFVPLGVSVTGVPAGTHRCECRTPGGAVAAAELVVPGGGLELTIS